VYVTVTRTKAGSEQPLEVSTIVGEEMTSWLRQIEGFEGLLLLSDEAGTDGLALTFWRDREVAERHRVARTRFRERVTAAVDATIEEVVDYEVSFAELGAGLAALQR
jgi:hypothetical protein